MRIMESLVRAAETLVHHHIPDSKIEAEVILRHVLGMERADFFASLNEPLAPRHQDDVRLLVQRRLEGEPLAYILGHREFYGLDFVVNRHVLIPRQETELLVDQVLSAARGRAPLDVADVGTGSGAIAIAIARHLPQATIYATDVRREALAVADVNRRRHDVMERVHLWQGDLLEALRQPVDIIVSNPPYIESAQLADLAAEVRREPPWALDGGADGLDITDRLLRQAPDYLRPGGRILVEIAPEQLELVLQLARQAFPCGRVAFARDLLGLPRVVISQLDNNRAPGSVGSPSVHVAVVQC